MATIKHRNAEYLGNHAIQLSGVSDLRYGQFYAVGRGKYAFLGFRMPGKDQVDRKGRDDAITLSGIAIYEASLDDDGKLVDQRVQRNSSLHLDDFLDVQHLGVFEPTENSELRDTIQRGLMGTFSESKPAEKAAK